MLIDHEVMVRPTAAPLALMRPDLLQNQEENGMQQKESRRKRQRDGEVTVAPSVSPVMARLHLKTSPKWWAGPSHKAW
jgi:hypothetical protein